MILFLFLLFFGRMHFIQYLLATAGLATFCFASQDPKPLQASLGANSVNFTNIIIKAGMILAREPTEIILTGDKWTVVMDVELNSLEKTTQTLQSELSILYDSIQHLQIYRGNVSVSYRSGLQNRLKEIMFFEINRLNRIAFDLHWEMTDLLLSLHPASPDGNKAKREANTDGILPISQLVECSIFCLGLGKTRT